MRIAAYNVENLFDRAKALNDKTPESSLVLKKKSELNRLFQKDVYTKANKTKMLRLMEDLKSPKFLVISASGNGRT